MAALLVPARRSEVLRFFFRSFFRRVLSQGGKGNRPSPSPRSLRRGTLPSSNGEVIPRCRVRTRRSSLHGGIFRWQRDLLRLRRFGGFSRFGWEKRLLAHPLAPWGSNVILLDNPPGHGSIESGFARIKSASPKGPLTVGTSMSKRYRRPIRPRPKGTWSPTRRSSCGSILSG